MNVSTLDDVSEVPCTILIFNSFFILFFQLGDFHYSVYLIADPFFCVLSSAIDSLYFSFQLSHSSVLFYIIYVFKFSLSCPTVLQSFMSIFMTLP